MRLRLFPFEYRVLPASYHRLRAVEREALDRSQPYLRPLPPTPRVVVGVPPALRGRLGR